VVWCKSKKGTEKIRSFELSRQKIFSYYDETKLKEVKKTTEAKRVHIASRAYHTGHVGSRAMSKLQWARITLHAGFTKILCHDNQKNRVLLTAARA